MTPRRLRVGVVGASPTRGWALVSHLPALQGLEEFELTAVSTTRMETATASAQAFGAELAFDDATKLVESPQVDVVVVAVKVPEHAAITWAALSAGKHVYTEWPLGIDLAQATSLAELAARSGVRHVVGLQGWFAPGPRFARELVEGGRVGQPLAVSVVASGGPSGRRIDQAEAFTTDVAAGTHLLSVSTGHILATLERAIGTLCDVSAVVASVNREAVIVQTGETIAVSAPDQVVLAGRLDNGAMASVTVQGEVAPAASGFELRIVGSDATLTARPATGGGIHRVDWAVTVSNSDGSTEVLSVPKGSNPLPEGVPVGSARNVALLYRELARAIEEDRPAEPNFATAVRFHGLLETIQRASDTGTRQVLNPN